MTSQPGGPPGSVLYAGAALADGLSPALRTPVSVAVTGGIVTGIFDGDGAERAGAGTTVGDASGATILPGLVDCHSHLTLQGGAQWIARGSDPTPVLVDAAERNAVALSRPECGGSGTSARRDGPTPATDARGGRGGRPVASLAGQLEGLIE